MKAEQLTDPITHHGEGAVWWPAWGGLKCVDMLSGDVLSIAGDGSVDRLPVGSPIAAMVRPRASGGFVVATERGFSAFAAGASGAAGSVPEWSTPALWENGGDGGADAGIPAAGIRMNEGGCDPEGRLLCGTMAYDETPGAGSMWRLTAVRSTDDGTATTRTVDRLFGGLTVSNGLGFTADGARMYYVDSPTRRIDVFDHIDGELRDRRPFVTVESAAGGVPDGLCVDSEGGVWTALYDGSAVHHYDASGRLADVVEVPARKVTSCTLGGDDLSTLYITTSREGVAPGDDPLAGSLFTAPAGVRGLPALPFAG